MSPASNKNTSRLSTALRIYATQHSVMILLAVFIILLCASLVALDFNYAHKERDQRLAQTERVLTNFTRALAQHAEDKIKEADSYLYQLVERLQINGMGKAHAARLHPLLMEAVTSMPQLHGIFVYDETGRWIVNSQPVLLTRFNNSDRNYFIHHKHNADKNAFIGPPIRSRSTGDWIITVSHRVNKPDGSFGGVALATMAMKHFNEHYQGYDIGRKGTITLLQSNGALLARHPFAEERMGTQLADQPLYSKHVLAKDQGSLTTRLDNGEEYIVAFRHLERYPVAVVVSQSRNETLAGWQAEAQTRTLGVVFFAMLLSLLGLFVLRLMGQRITTERKLRNARDALHSANQRLQRLAAEDSLTGLANRRAFDAHLDDEISRAQRDKSPLSLLIIDVDHFKPYNDIYGHIEGDNCLQKVAELILHNSTHRGGDFAARYGGEEFVVLLSNTSEQGAREVAERLRHAVYSSNLPHAGSPFARLTMSIGVAELPCATDSAQRSDKAEQLIRRADAALYTAKGGGRNTVICASSLPLD